MSADSQGWRQAQGENRVTHDCASAFDCRRKRRKAGESPALQTLARDSNGPLKESSQGNGVSYDFDLAVLLAAEIVAFRSFTRAVFKLLRYSSNAARP